jgi:hypothetical protein
MYKQHKYIATTYGISGCTLFPYQESGIQQLATHTRPILCDEMGLGKTIQTIGALYIIHTQQNPTNLPHLIVVPKAELADQWEAELTGKTTWASPETVVTIKSIEDLQEVHRNPISGKIVIATYEVVKKVNSDRRQNAAEKRQRINFEYTQTHGKRYSVIPEELTFWFGNIYWKTLVCDEIHTMGSILSYQFDSLRPKDGQLGGICADFRYALTGTPVKKTMHEIVATLAIVYPGFDYTHLKSDLHTVAKELGSLTSQLKMGGAINKRLLTSTEALHAILTANQRGINASINSIAQTVQYASSNYILRNRQSVQDELAQADDPKLRRLYRNTHFEISIDPTSELVTAAQDANQSWNPNWSLSIGASTLFHTTGQRADSELIEFESQDSLRRSQAVLKSRQLLYPHKLAAFNSHILPRLNAPTLIAVKTTETATQLKRDLTRDTQLQVFTIKNLAAFQALCKSPDSKLPILILPIDSTGLNLVEAKALVLFDQPEQFSVEEQIMARIDRMGQTSDVTFFSFKPETKADQFYHSICSIQRDAMKVLINPTSLADPGDGVQGQSSMSHDVLIASFFLAKAVYEIMTTNIIKEDSTLSTPPTASEVCRHNQNQLLTLSFKDFFSVFKSNVISQLSQPVRSGDQGQWTTGFEDYQINDAEFEALLAELM